MLGFKLIHVSKGAPAYHFHWHWDMVFCMGRPEQNGYHFVYDSIKSIFWHRIFFNSMHGFMKIFPKLWTKLTKTPSCHKAKQRSQGVSWHGRPIIQRWFTWDFHLIRSSQWQVYCNGGMHWPAFSGFNAKFQHCSIHLHLHQFTLTHYNSGLTIQLITISY